MFSIFKKIGSALKNKIRSLFSKGVENDEELERLLYEADLGAELASQLVEEARKKKISSPDAWVDFLKSRLLSLFPPLPPQNQNQTPWIILIVGVNGSGKTTTVAKLAERYKRAGKKVLIGAADTFRAAAIEQLEHWANRVGVDLVKGQPKGDPAAVAFDAVSAGIARKMDLVLIDTAGRLQNKSDLMQELAKVRRSIQKASPSAPHETLLVLDSTLGQNALDQAKTFHQFTPLSGVVLTKLDGSAKGGIAVAIQHQLSLPILWAGLGETAEDLVPFDPERFVDGLLGG